MSGVYIKKLKLPTAYEGMLTLRIKPSGTVDAQWDSMVGCEITEAVEVPDHGDLIDRDELNATDSWEWIRHNAPVVIPAERSEE